jgi:hypothetical protein
VTKQYVEKIALMPLDATWQYNLACALAYRAEKKEALGALDRAIELGFRDAKQIAEDKDLASLVSLPEFQALLKKAASLAGKPVPNQIQVRPSTVVMGYPAQVNASNTIWDLDLGCFRTSFQLLAPENKPVRAFAESYEGASNWNDVRKQPKSRSQIVFDALTCAGYPMTTVEGRTWI